MRQTPIRRWEFAILVVCAAAILGGISSNAAITGPPQEMNFTLEGKISKHTPGRLTVSGEGNIYFHVTYNDKTEIKRKDGSAATAKDLRVGLMIRAEGELTESGEVTAQRISIQSESPQK